jgi:hypothetical protein
LFLKGYSDKKRIEENNSVFLGRFFYNIDNDDFKLQTFELNVSFLKVYILVSSVK